MKIGEMLDAPRAELCGNWYSCDFAGRSLNEIEYFTAYKSPDCPFRVGLNKDGKWHILTKRGYYLRHRPGRKGGKGNVQLYASAWRAAKRAEEEDERRADGRGE